MLHWQNCTHLNQIKVPLACSTTGQDRTCLTLTAHFLHPRTVAQQTFKRLSARNKFALLRTLATAIIQTGHYDDVPCGCQVHTWRQTVTKMCATRSLRKPLDDVSRFKTRADIDPIANVAFHKCPARMKLTQPNSTPAAVKMTFSAMVRWQT
jgi:hypothetical protein